MTAKPETAAEVLADINKLIAQNPLHDVSIGGFKTYLGHLIEFRDRLERALSAQGEAVRHLADSPEDRFEQFVQAEIARSPEPLRELGEYLADALDEDKFPRANSLLLQLATSYTRPAPARVTEEIMRDRMNGLRDLCGYVEDGSSQTISIGQDDATKEWAIRRGGKILGFGATMTAAVDAALEADK